MNPKLLRQAGPCVGLCVGLCAPAGASAAEVTELPSPLRGSVGLEYEASGHKASLVESEEIIGTFHQRAHSLTLEALFSPVRGLALGAELPVALDERLVWQDAHHMVFDPILGSGSYVGTDLIEPQPVLQGGGLSGPLLLLRAAPLHQHLYTGRSDRTSWVLEGGYRLQDKSSFWEEKQAGKRGAGTGADALHLRSAWSTERRTNRPYAEVAFERAFTVPTTLRDSNGAVLAQGKKVRPATTFDLRVGTELPALHRGQLQVTVDLRGRAGYRSYQDIPSGVYLPEVLEASRAILVTQSEQLQVTGGAGLLFRVDELLDVNLGGDAGTRTPMTVEHPYAVSSRPGELVWTGSLALRLWIDDRLLGIDAPATPGPTP